MRRTEIMASLIGFFDRLTANAANRVCFGLRLRLAVGEHDGEIFFGHSLPLCRRCSGRFGIVSCCWHEVYVVFPESATEWILLNKGNGRDVGVVIAWVVFVYFFLWWR